MAVEPIQAGRINQVTPRAALRCDEVAIAAHRRDQIALTDTAAIATAIAEQAPTVAAHVGPHFAAQGRHGGHIRPGTEFGAHRQNQLAVATDGVDAFEVVAPHAFGATQVVPTGMRRAVAGAVDADQFLGLRRDVRQKLLVHAFEICEPDLLGGALQRAVVGHLLIQP